MIPMEDERKECKCCGENEKVNNVENNSNYENNLEVNSMEQNESRREIIESILKSADHEGRNCRNKRSRSSNDKTSNRAIF
jgi:hypothetical protein